MTCPRYDFHIHTKYLGCANQTMEIPAIVRECESLGVTSLAITDHLNTLDKVELHVPIREDLEALSSAVDIYFGVELNHLGCDEGFAYSAEIAQQYGFQFAIGGIHSVYVTEYDLANIVDIQHRHHLQTCRDPLVQILVHPYWFAKGQFDSQGWPWFDSMKAVPEQYARELGQAACETGTAIEINGGANLENREWPERCVEEYIEYLAILAEEGVQFSLGSDAHDIGRLRDIESTWKVIERLGLGADRVWRPDCAPAYGRGS